MADSDVAVQRADMQAVMVIHGMGEQIPMDTIKGFVNAVWQKDASSSLLPGFPIQPRYGASLTRERARWESVADYHPGEHRKPAHISSRRANRLLRALLGGPYRWRDLGLVKGIGPRLAPPAAPSRSAGRPAWSLLGSASV